MNSSVSYIKSVNPGRLILLLCKYWASKFAVTYDERHGEVPLPIGQCSLQAEEGMLAVTLTSKDVNLLARLQQVIAVFLVRVAQDEPLAITWQQA